MIKNVNYADMLTNYELLRLIHDHNPIYPIKPRPLAMPLPH